jgi:hypothetical protein
VSQSKQAPSVQQRFVGGASFNDLDPIALYPAQDPLPQLIIHGEWKANGTTNPEMCDTKRKHTLISELKELCPQHEGVKRLA